jgi:hypothetical protein
MVRGLIMSTALNPDGPKTLERLQQIEDRLDELQKVKSKSYNHPLVVGLLCVVVSLIGANCLDNLSEDKPATAEILITDYDIFAENREQGLFEIGVPLQVENPKFSQRSFTIDQISISINVPDELRPELINISDYYENRDWIESFSYSHGTPMTVKPGDVVEIDSRNAKHTFILKVPGEYRVRVSVDYFDSSSKRPPLYGYFNIHLSEHGTIYTENLEFPIKLEPFEDLGGT